MAWLQLYIIPYLRRRENDGVSWGRKRFSVDEGCVVAPTSAGWSEGD